MLHRKFFVSSLSLSLLLAPCGFSTVPPDHPKTLDATSSLLIDGRAMGSKGLLSGGEILRAPTNQRVTLKLDQVGLLTLSGGATVQVGIVKSAAQAVHYSLGASILSGQIEVELRPDVNAFVHIMGAIFLASAGARFRLGVEEVKTSEVLVSLGNYGLTIPTDIFPQARHTVSPAQANLLKSLHSGTRSAASTLKPIGSLESVTAAGPTQIEGLAKLNFQLLWGNELIQAPTNGSTRARLAAVGQVTLGKETQARLNSVKPSSHSPHQQALIASLVSGEMTVKLDTGAGAYVQALNNNFIAPNGSSFRLMTRDGQTITEALPGAVEAIGSYKIEAPLPVLDAALSKQVTPAGTATRRYKIRPVGFDYSVNVAVRSTRQIQVQVTDENDRPVPDVPLIWGLKSASGKAVGSLQNAQTFQSVTNAQGIGTAPFDAGQTPGTEMFTVTIAGTTMTFSGAINVVRSGGGFWNVPTATPVLATVVAIAVIAGIAVKKNADEPQPIAPAIPIIIRP